jgi:hypothetical protein
VLTEGGVAGSAAGAQAARMNKAPVRTVNLFDIFIVKKLY